MGGRDDEHVQGYGDGSEPSTIPHTLTQTTTCIYTQMNHICTKPTRQASCIYIDSKQTSHGGWVVPE